MEIQKEIHLDAEGKSPDTFLEGLYSDIKGIYNAGGITIDQCEELADLLKELVLRTKESGE